MNLCDYNGITKIAEVANTNSDLFHANTNSDLFQLSFQRLPIAASRESNRIAFAIIFVLSEHAWDSTIGRVLSPALRALAEHIWRHCSYGNARQDPWNRG